MPFQAYDFNHVGYHTQRLETMSWDDKVASYILALHWSSGRGAAGGSAKLSTRVSGSKQRVSKRQLESHLDCVAVAQVNGKWYIASNRLSLTAHEILLTDTSIGSPTTAEEYLDGVRNYGVLTGNYEIVREGGNYMHAEMKILKRLKSLRILEQCQRIGVSKPCCPKCSKVLGNWQIDYTSFHAVTPDAGTWMDPRVGLPRAVAVL
jgi:OTT_1508-like deaminase